MANDTDPSQSGPPARHPHRFYVEGLRTEVDRLVALVGAAPAGADVPSCPGWTVHDLAVHVGSVHRWAAHLVATRAAGPVPMGDLGLRPPDRPVPAADSRWLATGGAALLEALDAADDTTPVWTFGDDRTARFWSRRQLHETTVHRADVELALGRPPVVEPAAALDGIDELVALLSGRPGMANRIAAHGHAGDTIHVHATDAGAAGGEWTFTVTDDGFEWAHDHAKGDVAVRGPAAALFLLLHNRLTTDHADLESFGDEAVLTRWLTATAI